MCKVFLYIAACLAISLTTTAQTVKRASSFYAAGIKASANGMYSEALVSFKKAIALNKMYDSAYEEMGNVYVKTFKTDSAVISYTRAITLNPAMTTSLFALGKIYREQIHNWDSAIICFSGALKTDSLNKETLYNLAWCYNTKLDYDNAIKYAVMALNIDSNYREGYNELGHAYNLSKKYTEGIIQFKKFIAISMNEYAIHYCGLCYIALKDKAGAQEMLELLKKTGSTRRADILQKKINALQ